MNTLLNVGSFCGIVRRISALSLYLLLSLFSAPLYAVVVYDSGGSPDNLNSGFGSDLATPPSGDEFPIYFTDEVAESFILNAPARIDSVTWYGSYFNYYFVNGPAIETELFRLQFYVDTGSGPTALPFVSINLSEVTSRVVGENDFGISVTEYQVTIDPLVLDPGSFWLGISNDTTGSVLYWFWEGTELADLTNTPYARLFNGEWEQITEVTSGADFITPVGFELGFALGGEFLTSIPIPGTVALMLAGLALMRSSST